MAAFIRSLQGKKTNLAVLMLVLTQIIAVYNGDQTIGDALNWILTGGIGAGLRAKMARDTGE